MKHSRWPETDARRALNKRLNDDRRDLAWIQQREIADAGDTVYRKMEFGEAIGERFNATEARRAGGISMIGIVEGHKLRPFRTPAQLPVLKRHLDRDLDGCRAVIRIENPAESLCGKASGELPGELDCRNVGRAQKRGVGKFVELISDRRVNRRVAMPMDIRPDGGIPVDILAASAVLEDCPAPLHEDERVIFRRAPGLHLRERVPKVLFIQRDQTVGCHAEIMERLTPGALQHFLLWCRRWPKSFSISSWLC